MKIQHVINLPIKISNITKTHIIYVVPQLSRSCIIGNDFIQQHNLQIDGKKQTVYFKPKTKEKYREPQEKILTSNDEEYVLISQKYMKIKPRQEVSIHVKPNKSFCNSNLNDEEYEITTLRQSLYMTNKIITLQKDLKIQAINSTPNTITIYTELPIAIMSRLNQNQLNLINQEQLPLNQQIKDQPDLADTDLNKTQKKELLEVLKSFPDVFSSSTGKTNKVKHEIKLLPDSKPCNLPPYRYAPARRQVIEENVQDRASTQVQVLVLDLFHSLEVVVPTNRTFSYNYSKIFS